MQALEHSGRISVEDYLAGEETAAVRHEYIGGLVYAMAGVSRRHSAICINLTLALGYHLRGKPCQIFTVDFKVRLRIANEDIFYYPDLAVTCDPRDNAEYFNLFPKVLIEVLSPSTERIDRREKFSSYTQIESLEEYILVAQDQVEVTSFRRAANWSAEVMNQPEQELRIPSLDFAMPLAAIYDKARPCE